MTDVRIYRAVSGVCELKPHDAATWGERFVSFRDYHASQVHVAALETENARLRERVEALRVDLQQVIITTDKVHSLPKMYKDVRLVCRVGLAEDDKAATGDEET